MNRASALHIGNVSGLTPVPTPLVSTSTRTVTPVRVSRSKRFHTSSSALDVRFVLLLKKATYLPLASTSGAQQVPEAGTLLLQSTLTSRLVPATAFHK